MTLRAISFWPADPLLAFGKAIIVIFQGLMLLAAAAIISAMVLVPFFHDHIDAELHAAMADPHFTFPIFTVEGVLLLGLAIVMLIFLFLRNFRRIVDTVGEGDPFVPVNAERLTGMAWLMLAVQCATALLIVLGYHAASLFASGDVKFETGDIDLSGVALVLTLFILARVFRKGTQMRDELEGTV